MTQPPIHLLLVEDNPGDVRLVNEMLAEDKRQRFVLHVAERLESALSVMREQDVTVILLDLQLPYFTGLQVLEWIRLQPALKRIPVVMFSSSSQASDINTAYDLGVNSYLVKPTDVAELGRILEAVCTYWLNTNHGPVKMAPRI